MLVGGVWKLLTGGVWNGGLSLPGDEYWLVFPGVNWFDLPDGKYWLVFPGLNQFDLSGVTLCGDRLGFPGAMHK